MRIVSLFLIGVIVTFFKADLYSQISREEYIEVYKELAISEMRRTGIPASIKLGQAILESNSGNSDLARKARNHFGIKCRTEWQGKTYYQDDDEKDECFRRYKQVEESYIDHSEFLKRARYQKLFTLGKDDYKAWAFGLKEAGYATNPQYAQLLIRVIEENKLYRFDQEILLATEGLAKDRPEEIETELDDFFERKRQERDEKPGKEREPVVYQESGSLHIQYNNNIKYIIARKGDSFDGLARELDLMPYQLPKYNERNRNETIEEGSIIYLQPKRSKAQRGKDKHEFKAGESLYSISQLYGIKLEKLRAMNGFGSNWEPAVGATIRLR